VAVAIGRPHATLLPDEVAHGPVCGGTPRATWAIIWRSEISATRDSIRKAVGDSVCLEYVLSLELAQRKSQSERLHLNFALPSTVFQSTFCILRSSFST